MRRLTIITEAQPVDATIDVITIVDGLPARALEAGAGRTRSFRVPTSTVVDGRTHEIEVTVVEGRWTAGAFAARLTREVMEAADKAGLRVDVTAVSRVTSRESRRHLGRLRWFRR